MFTIISAQPRSNTQDCARYLLEDLVGLPVLVGMGMLGFPAGPLGLSRSCFPLIQCKTHENNIITITTKYATVTNKERTILRERIIVWVGRMRNVHSRTKNVCYSRPSHS